MTEGGFALKVRDRVSGSIGQGKDIQDSSLTPSGVGSLEAREAESPGRSLSHGI